MRLGANYSLVNCARHLGRSAIRYKPECISSSCFLGIHRVRGFFVLKYETDQATAASISRNDKEISFLRVTTASILFLVATRIRSPSALTSRFASILFTSFEAAKRSHIIDRIVSNDNSKRALENTQQPLLYLKMNLSLSSQILGCHFVLFTLTKYSLLRASPWLSHDRISFHA